MKILFVSHAHPEFSAGGGEIAAADLFKGFRDAGHEAYSISHVNPRLITPHSGAVFHNLGNSGREFLCRLDKYDYFLHSSIETHLHNSLHTSLRAFLSSEDFDVVHFQHTANLGLEWLRICRECLPNAAIIYTLHEYLLICNRSGQMLNSERQVCSGWSTVKCSRCCPERSPADFRLRELFIKGHLENVDAFVSPSRFLISRFVDWGIPADKLHFIENGIGTTVCGDEEKQSTRVSPVKNRFGFFGQLNYFKGILVLLDAFRFIRQSASARGLHLNIHGANLDIQSQEFKAAFESALSAAGTSVQLSPQYRRDELPSLMRSVDWVVIPSIWYENSPLVIQEAYSHGRPVICSDIGGMAEKVINGSTGLHFRVGSSEDLAATLIRAASTPGLWEQLRCNLPKAFSVEESVTTHSVLYNQVISGRNRKASAAAG